MTYQDFIDTKRMRVLDSGIDINPSDVHPMLMPFSAKLCAGHVARANVRCLPTPVWAKPTSNSNGRA